MRAITAGALWLTVCTAHAAPVLTSTDEPRQTAATAVQVPMSGLPVSMREKAPAFGSSIEGPLNISDRPRFIERRRVDLPLLGPDTSPPPSSGFSFGPLRAEGFTSTVGKNGRTRVKPHIRLEGVSVLGGSIGGSLDTRGGMLTLNWQTGR